MRNQRFFLFVIIIITLLTLFINAPKQIHIAFTTPNIPLFNKKLVVDQIIPGIDKKAILQKIGIQRNIDFRKGLDLEGGTNITLEANMQEVAKGQEKDALASAKEVIERRVNFYGVSEPVVQTAIVGNSHRIIVEIPGVTDVNEAVNLIGQTAKLSFWEEGNADTPIASESALPFGIFQLLGPTAKKTELTGSDLKQTTVTFDPNTGSPQVQLSFSTDGSRKFAAITKRNVGKVLAIALDEQVIQAPRVNEQITGGSAVISGSFTTEDAKALQIQLNAGALPVSLSVLEQRAIGATLGNDSLQKSLFAGIIGFVIIVIFMCSLYGRLGFIASLALILYILINLAFFRLIPITLTLAGIAGFILSLGIAVDANILIFERMQEEIRAGKPRQAALDLGFSRAWASIRDSNIASLITSVVLYMNGTGVVRGFALTLAVGVIISMFSAITVTRTLLQYLYKK